MKNKTELIFARLLEDLRNIRIPLLLIALYFILAVVCFHSACPFAILTGFPCPGCGMTRAAFYVLTGHFHHAFETNAMIFLWIPFLIYHAFFRYVKGRPAAFAQALLIMLCLATFLYYIFRILTHTAVSVGSGGLLRDLIGKYALT